MKIWQMNDCDWWMAETRELAVADYAKWLGIPIEEEWTADVREMTDAELDRFTYTDDAESYRVTDFHHWQCECGAMADNLCRWNGYAYEHHHGYPIGHVLMRNIHQRSFRAELARRITAGATSEHFLTTEL